MKSFKDLDFLVVYALIGLIAYLVFCIVHRVFTQGVF